MKKLVIKHWLRVSVFATLFSFSAATGSAQFFNPPTACENTYVTSPNIGLTDHTSAYSTNVANISGYGNVNLVLAGWDHVNPTQPAGFSWQYLPPSNPCAILAQGIVPYFNCRDIEVAWVDAAGDPEIVVAYYQNGVGHMVDVYSLSTGVPVLMYTNTLSAMPNYTRISIDSHIPPYAVGIIWEDVGGLKTICGNTTGFGVITWSNILSIIGTAGETVPDLVFNHASGLWLQSVSYNPGTGNFTEFQYDFWAVMGTTGTTIAPMVNDVNFVGPCNAGPGSGRRCPYPNIDAPGHGPESWAYTYTTNSADISVRLFDQPTATFATVIVNNGTFGIAPINGSLNRYPFCYYNFSGCGSGSIVTAWHTTAVDIGTGTTAGYAGMQMTTDGSALLSATDYLGVAMNPTWASQTPVLSISKQDDGLQYMYTIFPEIDPMGSFQLEHKYPPLCFASFKGEGQEHSPIACNDEEQRAAFISSKKGTNSISVYPNPSDVSFSLSVPAIYQQEEMTLVVTNILGVVAGSYNGPAANANAYLTNFSAGLESGTYLINVDIKGKTKEILKVTKVH
jgi:hypothetical protein